jgi:glucoamylase
MTNRRKGIRDAAITINGLVPLYAASPHSDLSSATLFPLLESYIALSTKIQRTPNPSGTFSDLTSLGEPKFMTTGEPFTGSWGRPQRDGPALRAITLMAYLRAYNETHPDVWISTEERNKVFGDLYGSALPADSVIKADLEYTARYWREDGFDLWEEVSGLHMFTSAVQLRALREGADIARAFSDDGAADFYTKQANELEGLVKSFWNQDKGHLVETKNSQRSGLDCALLLGAIHGDPDGTIGGFAPYSDEVLVSLLELVKDQRYRFPINMAPSRSSKDSDLAGVGVGRYPEDVYDGYGNSPAGGNPWFLCTASVAETLFRTSSKLQDDQGFKVTERGLPFWAALLPKESIKADKVYSRKSRVFKEALKHLQSLGDEYLAVIRTHTDDQGALSEQFDRQTGFERGATDLTWSYGAFLQAVAERKRMMDHE